MLPAFKFASLFQTTFFVSVSAYLCCFFSPELISFAALALSSRVFLQMVAKLTDSEASIGTPIIRL